jgi:hypothetical protein
MPMMICPMMSTESFAPRPEATQADVSDAHVGIPPDPEFQERLAQIHEDLRRRSPEHMSSQIE